MNLPGVSRVFRDKIVYPARPTYDIEEGRDTLYVGEGHMLKWPKEGQQHLLAPPVYSEEPSESEIRAQCERFRMVTGELPETVILVAQFTKERGQAWLANPSSKRGVNGEHPIGVALVLRGAAHRVAA